MENKVPATPEEVRNDYHNFIDQQDNYIEKLKQASGELVTIESKMKYVLQNLSEVLKDLLTINTVLSISDQEKLKAMMDNKTTRCFYKNTITVGKQQSNSIKQIIDTFFIKLEEQPLHSSFQTKTTTVKPKTQDIVFKETSVKKFTSGKQPEENMVQITFGNSSNLNLFKAFIDEEKMEKMSSEQVRQIFDKKTLHQKIVDFIKAFTTQQGPYVKLTPLSILAGCLDRYQTIAKNKQIKENNKTKTNFFNKNKDLVTLTNNINSELQKHKQISLSTQDKNFASLIEQYKGNSIIFTRFITDVIIFKSEEWSPLTKQFKTTEDVLGKSSELLKLHRKTNEHLTKELERYEEYTNNTLPKTAYKVAKKLYDGFEWGEYEKIPVNNKDSDLKLALFDIIDKGQKSEEKLDYSAFKNFIKTYEKLKKKVEENKKKEKEKKKKEEEANKAKKDAEEKEKKEAEKAKKEAEEKKKKDELIKKLQELKKQHQKLDNEEQKIEDDNKQNGLTEHLKNTEYGNNIQQYQKLKQKANKKFGDLKITDDENVPPTINKTSQELEKEFKELSENLNKKQELFNKLSNAINNATKAKKDAEEKEKKEAEKAKKEEEKKKNELIKNLQYLKKQHQKLDNEEQKIENNNKQNGLADYLKNPEYDKNIKEYQNLKQKADKKFGDLNIQDDGQETPTTTKTYQQLEKEFKELSDNFNQKQVLFKKLSAEINNATKAKKDAEEKAKKEAEEQSKKNEREYLLGQLLVYYNEHNGMDKELKAKLEQAKNLKTYNNYNKRYEKLKQDSQKGFKDIGWIGKDNKDNCKDKTNEEIKKAVDELTENYKNKQKLFDELNNEIKQETDKANKAKKDAEEKAKKEAEEKKAKSHLNIKNKPNEDVHDSRATNGGGYGGGVPSESRYEGEKPVENDGDGQLKSNMMVYTKQNNIHLQRPQPNYQVKTTPKFTNHLTLAQWVLSIITAGIAYIVKNGWKEENLREWQKRQNIKMAKNKKLQEELFGKKANTAEDIQTNKRPTLQAENNNDLYNKQTKQLNTNIECNLKNIQQINNKGI